MAYLDPITGIKRCCSPECNETDPKAFNPSTAKAHKDRLQPYCRRCSKENSRKRFNVRSNRDAKNAARRELVKALEGRSFYALYTPARIRAKKSGIPFTITREFVLDLLKNTQDCPYLGLPIWRENTDGTIQWFTDASRGFQHNSPSLDQIIPGAGYTPDNVELISNRANFLKHDGTADELLKIATRLKLLEKVA